MESFALFLTSLCAASPAYRQLQGQKRRCPLHGLFIHLADGRRHKSRGCATTDLSSSCRFPHRFKVQTSCFGVLVVHHILISSPVLIAVPLSSTGALVTDLAPSAIAIGSYFCVADVILISQCLYYNTLNARRRKRQASSTLQHHEGGSASSEEEPLLARRRSASSMNGGLPGSQRQHSVRRDSTGLDPLRRIVTGEDATPQRSAWVTNTLSLVFVYVLGIAAWFISRQVIGVDQGPSDPAATEPEQPVDKPVVAVGMVLGYTSALCYLCARIPQIIKNWREKSTEGMFKSTTYQSCAQATWACQTLTTHHHRLGLALLFFLLSLTGNLTYGLSLFAYSQEGAYLVKALPWLLGSLGTIVEDSVIFVQFKLYSAKPQAKVDSESAIEG